MVLREYNALITDVQGGLQPIYIRDIPYNFLGTSSQCPMPGASIQGIFPTPVSCTLTCPLKRTVLIGNASEPTINFQATFVSFPGSMSDVFQEARPLTVGVTTFQKSEGELLPSFFFLPFHRDFFFGTRPVEAPVLSVSPFPRKLNYGAVELPLL